MAFRGQSKSTVGMGAKAVKSRLHGKLTDDPKHTDYILRLPVESDLADGEKTAAAVQAAAMKMLGQIG